MKQNVKEKEHGNRIVGDTYPIQEASTTTTSTLE